MELLANPHATHGLASRSGAGKLLAAPGADWIHGLDASATDLRWTRRWKITFQILPSDDIASRQRISELHPHPVILQHI